MLVGRRPIGIFNTCRMTSSGMALPGSNCWVKTLRRVRINWFTRAGVAPMDGFSIIFLLWSGKDNPGITAIITNCGNSTRELSIMGRDCSIILRCLIGKII